MIELFLLGKPWLVHDELAGFSISKEVKNHWRDWRQIICVLPTNPTGAKVLLHTRRSRASLL